MLYYILYVYIYYYNICQLHCKNIWESFFEYIYYTWMLLQNLLLPCTVYIYMQWFIYHKILYTAMHICSYDICSNTCIKNMFLCIHIYNMLYENVSEKHENLDHMMRRFVRGSSRMQTLSASKMMTRCWYWNMRTMQYIILIRIRVFRFRVQKRLHKMKSWQRCESMV